MSYTKQTWQAGDEVTSAKLNHMEDGINNVAAEVANFPVDIDNPQDGDILIYNATEQKWVSGSNNGSGFLTVHDVDGTLDKTWKEIYDALYEGKYVCIVNTNEYGVIQVKVESAYIDGTDYRVEILESHYSTDSENGYPVGSTPK